jgi:hypothetical protein
MREMMTADTWAGIGLGDIPGACRRLGRQIPESLHDPWHQLMGQSCGLARIQILFTGEMNGY